MFRSLIGRFQDQDPSHQQWAEPTSFQFVGLQWYIAVWRTHLTVAASARGQKGLQIQHPACTGSALQQHERAPRLQKTLPQHYPAAPNLASYLQAVCPKASTSVP